jgi:hypothetical protein
MSIDALGGSYGGTSPNNLDTGMQMVYHQLPNILKISSLSQV